jgi:hypothetical protein
MNAAFLVASLLSGTPQGQEESFPGLWKPVDLDVKDVPAGEAFRRVFEQAGGSIDLPDPFDDRKVTAALRGATFWQAVDEISRSHGDLRVSGGANRSRDFRLQAGPWVEVPICYRGPMRFSVYDAARIRDLRFPERRDRTDVVVQALWTPWLEPVRTWTQVAGALRLTGAEDDVGRPLLPEVPGEGIYERNLTGRSGGAGCAWKFWLQPASAEARRIRLEGVWEGHFLDRIESVEFAKPAEAVGQERKVGPLTFRLETFDVKRSPLDPGGALSFTVRVSCDPAGAPADWLESLDAVPLGRRVLSLVEIRTAGPGPLRDRPQMVHELKGGGPHSIVLSGWSSGPHEEAALLRLRAGPEVRKASCPVVFGAVALPEGP